MNINLFTSLGFTICSIIFLSLITVMVLLNKNNKSDSTFVYKIIILITFVELWLDFMCVFTIYNDSNLLFNNILNRLSLLFSFLLITSLIVYIRVFEKRKTDTIINREKLILLILGNSIVLFIISLFFDISAKFNYDLGFYLIGGNAWLVYDIYSICIVLYLVYSLFHNYCDIEKEQRIPLYVMAISYLVIWILKCFTININILSFIYSVAILTLYFTIESREYRLLYELEDKKKKAEIANKAKTEFLSNMSHRIRTPLNTILGFSKSLLEEKELNNEIVEKDNKNIREASLRLLDLINNILDISRIESGKELVDIKEYDLSRLVFEISSNTLSRINNENLKFNIDVNNDMPSRYKGDYFKITKIINKILESSISCTEYGKINLKIYGHLLENNLYELNFEITSIGSNMNEDTFSKSYEDLVKLGANMDNDMSDSQLGIIIAKNLLNIIGGKIEFKTEEYKVVLYSIKIEQEVVDNTKIGNIFENKNEKEEIELLDLTGKNVLVVDDNITNLKLASKIMSRYKFNIETAESGKECLELVKKNKYDIIFLDHMMPEMDGIATIKILKKLDVSIPPVIALTANSYNGLEDLYKESGFSDYLAKPINIKELNKLINKYFKKGGL